MTSDHAKAGSFAQPTRYRGDIDGLRAIAVSSVIVSHAWPSALPGGFVGVDVFFVISGYLITGSLIVDLQNDRFSLLSFYDRRIRRIFPTLIVVLLAATVFGWLMLLRHEFRALGRHITASALFSENLLLWSEANYFDASSNSKPLLHLWSLAIEEQFYIVWPILMYLAWKKYVPFSLLLLVFGVGSFGLNMWHVNNDPTGGYYSPLGRSWELMIGAGLAYLQVVRPSLLGAFKSAQSAAGAAILVIGIVLIDPERSFPGAWALLPTMGAFLLISGGDASWINRHILASKPFVGCGLISYPLYLWHWPLLSYGHIVSSQLPETRALALVAIAVALSMLTYLYVERPFRRIDRRILIYPAALSAGMFCALSCGVAILFQVVQPRLHNVEVAERTEWDFLAQLNPEFGTRTIGIHAFAVDRPDSALLIGDSHLAQYAERLDKVLASDPSRLGAVLAVGGGCIPIPNVFSWDLQKLDCPAHTARAYELAHETCFATVVIGAAWNFYFLLESRTYIRNDEGGSIPLRSDEGKRLAIAGLERQIHHFVNLGKKVVLLLDNPISDDFYAIGFKSRLLGSFGAVPGRIVTVDEKQMSLRDELSDVGRRAGASIIDPFSALCAGRNCRASTDAGQPIFRDKSHLNPDWAVDQARFIDAVTLR